MQTGPTAPAAAGQTQGEAPRFFPHADPAEARRQIATPPEDRDPRYADAKLLVDRMLEASRDASVAEFTRCYEEVIAALAALPPAPEPVGERSEPVAWLVAEPKGTVAVRLNLDDANHAARVWGNSATVTPLYAAPVTAPTPTGERALRAAITTASRIIAGMEPEQYIPDPYKRLKAVQDILLPIALAATPAPGGTE